MSYRDEHFKESKSNHGWYNCSSCGKSVRKSGADVDHIIPQSYGGSDDTYNLQTMCSSCNRSKGNSLRNVPQDLTKNIVGKTLGKLGGFFDW